MINPPDLSTFSHEKVTLLLEGLPESARPIFCVCQKSRLICVFIPTLEQLLSSWALGSTQLPLMEQSNILRQSSGPRCIDVFGHDVELSTYDIRELIPGPDKIIAGTYVSEGYSLGLSLYISLFPESVIYKNPSHSLDEINLLLTRFIPNNRLLLGAILSKLLAVHSITPSSAYTTQRDVETLIEKLRHSNNMDELLCLFRIYFMIQRYVMTSKLSFELSQAESDILNMIRISYNPVQYLHDCQAIVKSQLQELSTLSDNLNPYRDTLIEYLITYFNTPSTHRFSL